MTAGPDVFRWKRYLLQQGLVLLRYTVLIGKWALTDVQVVVEVGAGNRVMFLRMASWKVCVSVIPV